MLSNSTAPNPGIVGSSVHNVRIERLWRDTFRCVLSVFYQLFQFLESEGKLYPLSEFDLFYLHYVYIPRITKALDSFTGGWNNHAMTTESCATPIQMFTSGLIAHGSMECYNFEGDVNFSSSSRADVDQVEVPSTLSPLTSLQEMELASLVNPLQESSNYGIELFEQVKVYVLNNRH